MGHLWLLRTWFLLGLFRCAADASKDGSETIPKVTEVMPKYGSINGATRLTIKGEAFKGISLSCPFRQLEKPKQPTLHDNSQFEQHCRFPR